MDFFFGTQLLKPTNIQNNKCLFLVNAVDLNLPRDDCSQPVFKQINFFFTDSVIVKLRFSLLETIISHLKFCLAPKRKGCGLRNRGFVVISGREISIVDLW